MHRDHKETAKMVGNQRQDNRDSLSDIRRIAIRWENLSFTVNETSKPIEVLKPCSSYANPGEILAIMGPSGAGKTSLLSLLSNQQVIMSTHSVSGSIYLNNRNIKTINSDFYTRLIPQKTVLFDFLTPYEFLKFTLSLKSKESKQEVKKRVEKVIDELKLTDVQHTVIGNLIVRGISGSERKRVCIASELVLFPSVLILDEPTSGLDSSMAKSIMNLLKDVKGFGVTIIASIHQPSFEMFKNFDRLILMQDGNFVYSGKAKDSIDYFSSIGFQIPKLVNPPEFFMKLLRVEDRNNMTAEESETIEKLLKGFKANVDTWKDIDHVSYQNSELVEQVYEKSLTKSVKFLLWRELLNYRRNPFQSTTKVVQVFFFVALVDMIFNNLGYDGEGVDNRRGALVFIMIVILFIPSLGLTMGIAGERFIILKEIKEGLYSIHSYFITKIFVEIPVMIMIVVAMISGTYFCLDLNDEHNYKFFNLMLISIMIYTQGVAVGICAGTLSRNHFEAMINRGVILSTFMTFSGFFYDPESGPEATNWIRYASPFFFLRNAVFRNEFNDLDYDDDVLPEPDEKYNIEGEILFNVLITFVHMFTFYIAGYFVYRYQVNRNNLDEIT